jgi:hypothetical protein
MTPPESGPAANHHLPPFTGEKRSPDADGRLTTQLQTLVRGTPASHFLQAALMTGMFD